MDAGQRHSPMGCPTEISPVLLPMQPLTWLEWMKKHQARGRTSDRSRTGKHGVLNSAGRSTVAALSPILPGSRGDHGHQPCEEKARGHQPADYPRCEKTLVVYSAPDDGEDKREGKQARNEPEENPQGCSHAHSAFSPHLARIPSQPARVIYGQLRNLACPQTRFYQRSGSRGLFHRRCTRRIRTGRAIM